MKKKPKELHLLLISADMFKCRKTYKKYLKKIFLQEAVPAAFKEAGSRP